MPARRRPLSRTTLVAFAAGSLVALAGCAVYAQRIAFSFFATYDDEGHFLLLIREWLQRGDLFDGVYSEYGPGYVGLVGGIFTLFGLELDSDTARLVTLVLWLAITVLVAITVMRLTGNPVIAVGGQVVAFIGMIGIAQDPLYPGGWLSLLVVGIVLAAAFGLRRRPAPAMFAIGFLATAAALVKVNVGALAAIAVVVACVTAFPALRRIRALELTVAALCIATPFVVVASELHRGIVLEFALAVGFALAAVVASIPRLGSGPELGPRELRFGLGGIAAACGVILGAAIVSGSGPVDLIDGIIVQPLGQSDAFIRRFEPPSAAVWINAAGLGLAIAYRRTIARIPPAFSGAGRIAAGLWAWTAVVLVQVPSAAAFAAAGAFAWVAALPPGDRLAGPRGALVRALIPTLAVLMLIQAYPVAGSQMRLAVLPLVFVGGVCIADGLEEVAAAAAGGLRARWVALNLGIACFAAWLVLGPAHDPIDTRLDLHARNVPLGLPGAERARVSPAEHDVFVALVKAVHAHCATFYGEPGINSLYVWGEIEPPTGMSTGNWMYQFSDEQQRRALADLREADGLCIVRNQSLIDFWSAGRTVPGGPLSEWIDDNFEARREIGGYVLMTPLGAAGRS